MAAATLLKRKRTSSDAPFSFASAFDNTMVSTTTSTTTTTTTSSFNPVFGFPAMDPGRDAHLNSRTWKRSRSNRPSDDEVHRKSAASLPHNSSSSPPPLYKSSTCFPAERTLHLLLSAQQQQQQTTTTTIEPKTPAPYVADRGAPLAGTFRQHHTEPQQQRRQGSLHSFWAINSAPTAAPDDSMTGVQTHAQPLSRVCEDCGAALGAVPGGDDSMDIDGLSSSDDDAAAPCGNCGKVVCFSCSVSSLGEKKRCLRCADRRVWVGGIGWTRSEVRAY
ncbi:hypothetical protein JDV02_009051 [Purpureocillium takamizusanense]|uniref:Uncharacterized protein n=1 Tax=Purpureocillium takamizusanense TaxID=2060973 RepID=A0A9Q8QR27_9HYPO|nr:uncharacterized protein JDV02_009051 [Purpureocillium takamizusanense]UNI23219.1 hypothetical protein JDV02_009051 [Purpureocillium takamizusanense]